MLEGRRKKFNFLDKLNLLRIHYLKLVRNFGDKAFGQWTNKTVPLRQVPCNQL